MHKLNFTNEKSELTAEKDICTNETGNGKGWAGKIELAKRYLIFFAGIFFVSFGISFVTKANLGTSPISSLPYVLSMGFPFTLGQFTVLFSLFLLLLQVIILRRQFHLQQLLQIPISIFFGAFIDLAMHVLVNLSPETYLLKILTLLLGCTILAFGVYLQVLANVVMLPGEAFIKAVSDTFHKDFGFTKIVFDGSMVIVSIALSLILFQGIQGVREGTVIAALIVGAIARQFEKRLHFIKPRLLPFSFAREFGNE